MRDASVGAAPEVRQGEALGPNAAALAWQIKREQRGLLALTAPALLLVGFVALAPIGWLFGLSFWSNEGFTLLNYERLIHPSYRLTLITTFQLAFLVTAVCLALGYPPAPLPPQISSRGAHPLLP